MAGAPAKTSEPSPTRESSRPQTTSAIERKTKGSKERHASTCQNDKKEQQEEGKSPPQLANPSTEERKKMVDHASPRCQNATQRDRTEWSTQWTREQKQAASKADMSKRKALWR
jgi:hypothetical protein